MSGQASSVRYDLIVSIIDNGRRVEGEIPHDGDGLRLGFVSDGLRDPRFPKRLGNLVRALITTKRVLDLGDAANNGAAP